MPTNTARIEGRQRQAQRWLPARMPARMPAATMPASSSRFPEHDLAGFAREVEQRRLLDLGLFRWRGVEEGESPRAAGAAVQPSDPHVLGEGGNAPGRVTNQASSVTRPPLPSASPLPVSANVSSPWRSRSSSSATSSPCVAARMRTPLSYASCPNPGSPIGPGLNCPAATLAAEWQASITRAMSAASTSRSHSVSSPLEIMLAQSGTGSPARQLASDGSRKNLPCGSATPWPEKVMMTTSSGVERCSAAAAMPADSSNARFAATSWPASRPTAAWICALVA